MPEYLGYGVTFPVVWANQVRATGAALPVVGFVLLLMRLNVRRWQKRKILADDVFAFIAWVALAVMGAIFVWGANNEALGWRSPPQDGNAEAQIRKKTRTETTKLLLRLQYVFQIFMVLTFGFTKLSILWFCRRIFVVHKRDILDIITLGLTGLVSFWTLVYFLTYIFYCKTHPEAFWGSPLAAKRWCLAIAYGGRRLQYSMAITDMLLDVFCVIIPFPVIWGLHLSMPQKVWVTAVFSLGVLTVAVSAARTAAYFQVNETAPNPPIDIFLGSTITLYWSMLEAGLAYIASQLPALSQYLTRFSTFKITSTLKNAASWFSMGSRGGRSGNETSAAGKSQFHEMHDNDKRRPGQTRRDSETTAWSAPSLPDVAKTRDSQNSLLPDQSPV